MDQFRSIATKWLAFRNQRPLQAEYYKLFWCRICT